MSVVSQVSLSIEAESGFPADGDQPVSAFVNVKAYGAKGDGKSDDTTALQTVLNRFGSSKIIFSEQSA